MIAQIISENLVMIELLTQKLFKKSPELALQSIQLVMKILITLDEQL